MEQKSLESKLKHNNLEGLYLFYGEDQYSIEIILKRIKKIFGELQRGINYVQIDDTNLGQIIENIETPAFGYDKKLIIVRESGLFKKDSKKQSNYVEILTKYFKENISLINKGVVLIFIEKSVAKYSLYKTIEENGIVQNFEVLKLFEIINRLKEICKCYHVNADEKTLQYLCELSGTDMQNLINEIRKLIEYVGENGTITKQNIETLAVKQTESIIFELTDCLGKRDIKRSIDILRNLISSKEPIQRILIMIYNHFKKIYIVKMCQEYKKDITQSLDLKPNQTFLTSKFISQASYFTKQELREFLENLIELDNNSKQGLIDIQVGLEASLCKLVKS
ncbi:MAG: DNA polymerase III subunit delta [Clostridia bacterium]|nr:DNA polymerase III subunit delta [Clostridia bacterium]